MKKCLAAIIVASAAWGALLATIALDKWTYGVPSWAVALPLGCVVGTALGILEHKMEDK